MNSRFKCVYTVLFLCLSISAIAGESAIVSQGKDISDLLLIAPIGAIIGLIFSWYFFKGMVKSDEGTDRMKEIAGHVRKGAQAYLTSQYKIVTIVVIILFFVFTGMSYFGLQNPIVPLAFITGALFSGICGYIGMNTATLASNRTAQACSISLNDGLRVSFRSGAVMGLTVVGIGLLSVTCWFLVLNNVVYTAEHMANGWLFLVPEGFDATFKLQEITTAMMGFAIGASLQALFARVGGGIFTKAADVGADLVGKVEAGIPEDDPRNPATIADNVGDNVGDVAGMGADLYESYCGSILATAALGASLPLTMQFSGISAVVAPMVISGLGIILSVIGVLLVRCGQDASMKALLKALDFGIWSSTVAIIAISAALSALGYLPWGIFGAITTGLLSGIVIGLATGYFTSDEYAPTQGIAEQAKTGAATTIIDGIAVGMFSSSIPVVTIMFGIILSFGFAGGFTNLLGGLYGIGFAAVGMLATLGITLATDAYGPIADNAGGNAEMCGLPPEVRERTDALDMLGNTTAAIGKGFAIGSAALTALALLATFIMGVQIWSEKLIPETVAKENLNSIMDYMQYHGFHLLNPLVICGLFLGAMMCFVFCALTMKAVGRAAGAMVEEVRRQFKEIPGIMEGEGEPDYARCVEISTQAAQKEMIIPSIIAVIVPILTGLIFGVAGIMGLLAGGLATAFSLACLLNNAGGAWDNAKKYIEKGNFGGKGSDVHKATVVGDTVGDPFKDTSGPALNILIKLMSMVCVVFTPLFVQFAPKIQAFLNII